MSMDLSVWSPQSFELPAQLPNSSQWRLYARAWTLEAVGWHIQVLPAADHPDSNVLQKLPGASHVAYVTLEPIGADDIAYDLLEKVVRTLARVTSGVWVDPNGEPYFHDEGQFR
jgi:hypothetical protein